MKENRFFRRLAVVLMIAVGCAATFSNIRFSDWLVDECYQALSVRDYANAPLAMLSYAIGHVWTAVFGESLVSLRILRSICYIVAVGMCCLWMWRHVGRPLLTAFLFMLLTLSFPFATLEIYGWDVGSYPFLALAMITGLWYIKRPTVQRVALWSLTIALAVMSRLTLGVLLPIAMVTILSRRRTGREQLIDCVVGFGLFVVMSALIMTALVGSPKAFFDALNQDNIITGHMSPRYLMHRFVIILKIVLATWIPGSIAVMGGLAINRFFRWRWIIVSASVVVLVCVSVALYLWHDIGADPLMLGYWQPLALLGLVVVLSLRQRLASVAAIYILACSLAAMVGSDGFFERVTAFLALPFLFSLMRQRDISAMQPALLLYVIPTICFLIFNFQYYNTLCAATADEYPRLRYSRFNPDLVMRIRTVDALSDSLSAAGKSNVYIGMGKYEMTFVMRSDAGFLHHYYHYNILEAPHVKYADSLVAVGYDAVVAINGQPGNNHFPIVDLLEQRGYVITADTPHYLLMEKASRR